MAVATGILAYDAGPDGPWEPPDEPWWEQPVALALGLAELAIRAVRWLAPPVATALAVVTGAFALGLALARASAPNASPPGLLPIGGLHPHVTLLPALGAIGVGALGVATCRIAWRVVHELRAGNSLEATWLRPHVYGAMRVLQFALEAGASLDSALVAAVRSSDDKRARYLLAQALAAVRDDAPLGRALWETGLFPPALRAEVGALRGRAPDLAGVAQLAEALRPAPSLMGWTGWLFSLVVALAAPALLTAWFVAGR